MKRQILLFLSIAVSTFGMAQVNSSFGLRGGVLSSGMSGQAANSLSSLLDFTKGSITTSSRTGFFGGAYVTVPINNIFSLEPALYYAQKGYEMKGTFNLKGAEFLSANAKAQLNTHYIDLPLLVKANISGLQLFAGPQLSYLTGADLHTMAGVLGINLLNKKIDASQQFNRWDAAITGGIGYQFLNGLNITAAYDYGLSRTDANKSLNAYNRSVRVGIGINL